MCASSSDTVALSGATPGVLEISAIGVVAPVLDGISDSELNVAVGHDPMTPWPGNRGEAIFEAHDVSYFSNLSLVRPGMTIIWRTQCAQARFQVLSTAIMTPGSAVYPPSGAGSVSGSGLALVTCYPTNALFWTSQRFVVKTRLVGVTLGSAPLPSFPSQPVQLTVNAPTPLVAQGLTLASNSLMLGRLHLSGTFAKSWTESSAPLQVEALALEVLFGSEKAFAEENSIWWSDLAAPGLHPPRAWPQFSTTDVTIHGVNHQPSSVTFSSSSAVAVVVVRRGALYLGRLS